MALPFSKPKTKIPEKDITAQQLISVDEINDSLLYTNEHIMYAFFRVSADGDSLYSPERKMERFEFLTQALEVESEPWQLLSVPHVVDTYSLMQYLLELKKGTNHHNRLRLLDGEIEQVRQMAEEGIREPVLYLKLWKREGKRGEEEFSKRLQELYVRLHSLGGFRIERLKDQQIAYLCRQYAEIGEPIRENETQFELPKMAPETSSLEISLLDEITPIGGIEIGRDHLYLGGTKAAVYGVTGYPAQFNLSWASELLGNTSAITGITYEPANPSLLADALSRSVAQAAAGAELARNRRDQRAKAREVVTADELLEDVDGQQVAMGTLTILTMPFARDEADFEKVCGATEALFRNKRMRLKKAGRLQREGLMSLLPYQTTERYIEQQFGRLMHLKTLVGGSPFNIESLRDPKGLYFAETNSGSIVSLDMWVREQDRTNSNFITFGKPGVGKSTLIKHILQSEIMKGTKIIIIDPQSEYHDITRYLGGTIINMSGGKATVNIFDVAPPLVDADQFSSEEEYSEYMESGVYEEYISSNVLAVHIQEMLTFFRAYFRDAGSVELALLEKAIVETYGKKGITWDTNFYGLTAVDYPILTDLLALVAEKLVEDEAYKTLCIRLDSMATCSAQFMFNGHTNVELDSSIICLDVKELQSMDINTKGAQFMNILKMAWRNMCKDPTEEVLLVVDEGYVMADASLPEPLRKLRDMAKQCRKFGGAVGFISHDIIDVLAPAIRQYSQAIISVATYKYFMGTDGKNLQETQELFNLTPEQVEVLRKGVRGDIIAMIGSAWYYLKAEIPQYKLENMGTAGGR